MFVTVLFGDNRMEMFNLNCKLIYLIRNLKERCGVDFKECVDLMDGSGAVMNLQAKQHSGDVASSLLAERQYYVLLRVCRNDDTGGQTFVSLLDSVSQSHPEITKLLRKLNPSKERDRKVVSVRRGRMQRSSQACQSRSKHTTDRHIQ